MFANHDNNVKKPVQIIILGSGFAGVEVLKKLQKEFRNNDSIVITMISKDNYLLFTPMLPEVATGTVETRHIIAPVRSFCNKASFHEATVQLIATGTVETRHIIAPVRSFCNKASFHEATVQLI